MIDVHAHLIPQVDDGSHSFEDSVEIVRGLSSVGVTDIIITPHFVSESTWTSSRYKNQLSLTKLKTALKKANIKVNLYLGNEIYIDQDIQSFIDQKLVNPLAGGKYLLVELPMSGEFPQCDDILLTLIRSGWHVILAHPERYTGFYKNLDRLYELSNMGVLFQCNLGSVIGQYGRKPQKTIKKMAKEHLIWCFGTDIHHTRDYAEITKAQIALQKYYSEDELNQLLVNNPRKILRSAR